MAELVDAPDSKSGVRKDVWVRFPLWLQNNILSKKCKSMNFVCCNCGHIIHGPSMVVKNKILHLDCAKKLQEEKEEENLEEVK